MRRTTLFLAALALAVAGVSYAAGAQERVKAKGPADFDTVYASIKKQYAGGHFGKAYASAQELLGLIGARRAVAIRAALPAAPADYEKVPFEDSKNAAQQNAMLAAMAPSVGSMIQQSYRGPGGEIKISVMADSPLMQMFKMAAQNPAMLGEDSELIKYGDIMAILETQGSRKTLKIMIDNSMVESTFPNHDDDFVFAMWNQAAVDKVRAAIAD